MSRTSLLLLSLALPFACDKPTEASKEPPPAKAGDKAEANNEAKPADESPKPDDATPADAPAPTDQAVVGKPAPAFSLTDLNGKPHALADYKGKTVVLEWFNPQCPFVKFAHTEGPLATMAKEEIAKGVVWLSINSGAPGKQGHGAEANREGVATYGMENPVLLDEDGAVGRTYGAAKTPHVYIVDGEGTLRYRGALDNAPFGETQGEDKVNYVAAALKQLADGQPIATADTPPYGCTVKYAKG